MSILQSYDIQTQVYATQPFEHYKGKPGAHGLVIQPNRQLVLNYLRPDSFLPGSDIETVVNNMIASERKFVALGSLAHAPISINITKAGRSPINWNVTYLFPVGVVEDYLSQAFESNIESFIKDSTGMLSWSFTGRLDFNFYAQPTGGKQEIKGYTFGDALFNITATTDFEIPDYQSINSIPTEGLSFSPNPHTLNATVKPSEDTGLVPTWNYTWEFTLA